MLTRLYRWDYWTTQAQPSDYLEELIASLNAAAPAEDAVGEITPEWLAAKRVLHAGKIKRYIA